MNWLNEIATIHMGYPFRRILKDATSDRSIIQMMDARPDKIGQVTAFASIQINTLPNHFPLRVGDLLFRSRGRYTNSVLIEKIRPMTLCAAPLMLIRVRTNKPVLPAYLNWFINTPRTQRVLDRLAKGEKNRVISLTSMAGLEVLLPTLAAQHHIVNQDRMARQLMIDQTGMFKQAQDKLDDHLWRYASRHRA